jgi:mannose-1-phosphate guanylyltransferase/mannose-6-phosphate isomerase
VNAPLPPILPVILCGGAGTRLWPVSTEAAPKPFHALLGDRTLFQQTLQRVAEDQGFLAPMIVCGRTHRALVESQTSAQKIAPSALVLEPCGRGTAPIAAIASSIALRRWPQALVLLLSADHLIADEAGFRGAIHRAAALAGEWIVCLGVAPSRPATGYGYIKSGARLADGIQVIDRFVEKPDLATAETYVASGDYSWNAGMFLFSPAMLLDEMTAARPDIVKAALDAIPATDGAGVVELDEARFYACPPDSIDRAVMERTRRAAVATAAFDWADIGAWDEVWRLGQRDAAGNALRGAVHVRDASDSLIWSDGPTVAAIGVSDLVIVASRTGVLVAPLARAQEVRILVEQMTADQPPKT